MPALTFSIEQRYTGSYYLGHWQPSILQFQAGIHGFANPPKAWEFLTCGPSRQPKSHAAFPLLAVSCKVSCLPEYIGTTLAILGHFTGSVHVASVT